MASPNKWAPAAQELSSPSSTSIASEHSIWVPHQHARTSAQFAKAAAAQLAVIGTEFSNVMHRLGHFPAAKS